MWQQKWSRDGKAVFWERQSANRMWTVTRHDLHRWITVMMISILCAGHVALSDWC